MPYATGSTGLAITVRGSSRRIMIMRFRPANIRLINRRSNLPRLLLALSSGKSKNNDNDKNNPIDSAGLTRSLHIRPMYALSEDALHSERRWFATRGLCPRTPRIYRFGAFPMKASTDSEKGMPQHPPSIGLGL